jgi:hypothetical protein
LQEFEVLKEVASEESRGKCQVDENLRFVQERLQVSDNISLCRCIFGSLKKHISKFYPVIAVVFDPIYGKCSIQLSQIIRFCD